MNQPLNNLAPFRVTDDNGEIIIQVDENGVTVKGIRFPDGSYQYTAGTVTSPSTLDSGTF